MKKLLSSILMISFGAVLISCGNSSTSSSSVGASSSQNTSSATATNSIENINTVSTENVAKEYLNYALPANLLGESFSSAEEIGPDNFSYFYTALSLNNQVPDINQYEADTDGNPLVPKAVFEDTIQHFFDVSNGYLESSPYYNADTETYSVQGIGGASDVKVNTVTEDGNLLEIKYTLLQDGNEVGEGTLIIAKTEEGNYKYIENTYPNE